MNDRTILNIGVSADFNWCDVASQRAPRPNARVLADGHIAHHEGSGCNERRNCHAWRAPQKHRNLLVEAHPRYISLVVAGCNLWPEQVLRDIPLRFVTTE